MYSWQQMIYSRLNEEVAEENPIDAKINCSLIE